MTQNKPDVDNRPLEPITGRPTTFLFLALAALPVVLLVFIMMEAVESAFFPNLAAADVRGLHFTRGVVLSWMFGILAAAGINKTWARAAERIRAAESRTRAALRSRLHRERLAAIGSLAAGVAHEVGNPLASISAIVQLMLKRGPDDTYGERLKTIKSQIDRIERIIRHLLNFSKPPTMETTEIDVGALLDEITSLLAYSPRHGGIVMRRIVEPPGLRINAGRGSLEQILMNLALNAADAMDGLGMIEISCQCRPDRSVSFAVRDYGPGIPEDIREKIFDPFFSTKESGCGLGLAVTKSLVQEMKGTIRIDSPPGGGTEFRIEFPPPA